MTLAAILLFSVFFAAPASPVAASGPRQAQSTPATEPAKTPGTTDQGTKAPVQTPAPQSTPTTKTPAPSTPTTTVKKPRRKKKSVSSNCVSPTSGSVPLTSGSAATGPTGTGSAATDPAAPDLTTPGSTPATAAPDPTGTHAAPLNCPPSKIIVRQGGTSEPSIQLAGGAVGAQAAHQRETANQMLGATEKNLKQIDGQKLSPSQQDMVNQIHQFMQQSKTAVAAGDLERGRTLAWKAQLLSEELIKPQK